MIRSVLCKAAWVGRTASMVLGLALVLGLVVGLADAALGANGQAWVLGQINKATATTQLNASVGGKPALVVANPNTAPASRALHLNVAQGRAPMAVNPSAGKATNLNADKLDGKDATQIGVNGLQRAFAYSANNSNSPKSAVAPCPSGTVVVGSGFDILGGKSGTSPDALANVVVDQVNLGDTQVFVEAYEEEATTDSWSVMASARCATAP